MLPLLSAARGGCPPPAATAITDMDISVDKLTLDEVKTSQNLSNIHAVGQNAIPLDVLLTMFPQL